MYFLETISMSAFLGRNSSVLLEFESGMRGSRRFDIGSSMTVKFISSDRKFGGGHRLVVFFVLVLRSDPGSFCNKSGVSIVPMGVNSEPVGGGRLGCITDWEFFSGKSVFVVEPIGPILSSGWSLD
jgi:hypothetical protein